MANDTKVGLLEEEALKRKERLRGLKRKPEQNPDGTSSTIADNLPKPVFRSYKPQHETLKQSTLPDTKPADLESEVKEQLEASKSNKMVIEELDITNLAPRKPDWDLKRDIAKKLDKLERRTQKAIAELIRDRLRAGQQDLSSLVNVAAITNKVDNRAHDDE